jgi:hypothetical protein
MTDKQKPVARVTVKGGKFKCSICEDEFTEIEDLRDHQSRVCLR